MQRGKELSQEQTDELQSAFDMFDKNKDGRITATELRAVMVNLRLEPTEVELQDMIKRFDQDGNGTVEFNEFSAMMAIFLKRKKKSSAESKRQREESELRQAFKVFDIDGDGLIDAHELRQTMNNLGENVTDKDVQAMIKSADKNADNKIDFDEFASMMKPKK